MKRPVAEWTTLLAGLLCVLIMSLSACDDDGAPPCCVPPQPVPVLGPSTPENLILDLMMIYNDEMRGADERLQLYTDLFPPAAHDSLPDFVFHFQPVDVRPGEDPTWGLEAELQAHRNIFQAQAARDVFSLQLTIQYLPATPMEQAPGQMGWQSVFATDVNLRLMFSPQDGILVDGGQARFICSPADDRWYINEWTDLPRPFAPGDGRAVESTTWGDVKASFK